MDQANTTDQPVDHLPLDDLLDRYAPRNPKQHDVPLIRGLIARFGFVSRPEIDERTGRLVVGHGRCKALAAMRADGETPPAGILVDPERGWLVPVLRGWSSRSDAEAEAYLVGNNEGTIRGGWNNPELAVMLADLAAVDPTLLEVTGYTAGELEDLLKMATPLDLDDLAGTLGEPDPSDTWPIVRVKVPPHVAAAWRSHLETHDDDEVAAFAALLEVDPAVPEPAEWAP